MTKFATPKTQYSHDPATCPVFSALGIDGEPGILEAAPSRKRARYSHQIWTRADGFTLSGSRRG